MPARLDADVIVAGAGPAGAATAAHLARAGVDVLLLERAHFPRDKVCGDFLGPVAVAELQNLGVLGFPGVREANVVEHAALFVDGEQLIDYVLPRVGRLPPYGFVVPRLSLDAVIANAATCAGARLWEGQAVSGFAQGDDSIAVAVRNGVSNRTLQARVLVGADGSASAVARTLHGRPHARDAFLVAARAYFEGVAGPVDRCDLAFTSESFPGYAWVFPTGEGAANVGVGMVVDTFPDAGENMQTLLERLVRGDPAMRARLSHARMRGAAVGWPLATYRDGCAAAGHRVVLVGDAAGLINPSNGEGIQAALCSARWAAETIVDALRRGDVSAAALNAYASRVRGELGLDMLLARTTVRAVANRALNPLWLTMLRGIVSYARLDQQYAHVTGGVLAGIVPVRSVFAPKVLVRSAAAIAVELGRGVEHACTSGMGGVLDRLASLCASLIPFGFDSHGAMRWARTTLNAARAAASAARSAGMPSADGAMSGEETVMSETPRGDLRDDAERQAQVEDLGVPPDVAPSVTDDLTTPGRRKPSSDAVEEERARRAQAEDIESP